MAKKKKVKRKLKYKNIIIFLIILILLLLLLLYVIKLPITNIYIDGNNYYSDLDIMKISKLEDYPLSIKTHSFVIKKYLEDNEMILSAKVSKKWFSKIYIKVNENRPLFYNSNINKLVMFDRTNQNIDITSPYLLNYIPDTIYNKFIDAMILIDEEVLLRISEIEYNPNDVDKERFLLTMNDGNYVYININTYSKLNSYIDIIKKFENKRGILYLDSGEYFEIR